jgi:uracil-DNA glycosylase
MRGKPKWCYTNCPCATKTQGFAKDSGDPLTAILAFVWEAPGYDETQKQEAAVGKTGELFNRWLRELGVDRSEVLVCNTVRCRWGTNDYPKGDLRVLAEDKCRHWDEESLITYNPEEWWVTYHPAAYWRVNQYEEYIKMAIANALASKHKSVVLMGEKAMSAFMPWLRGGVDRWKGHHEILEYSECRG